MGHPMQQTHRHRDHHPLLLRWCLVLGLLGVFHITSAWDSWRDVGDYDGESDRTKFWKVGLRRPFRPVDVLNHHHQSTKTQQKRVSGSLSSTTTNTKYGNDDESDVETHYFDQRLDHFRPSDSRTFDQRYFYSRRYVRSPTSNTTSRVSLAFICVGGEGPDLTTRVLVDSVHCTGDMLETAHRLYSSPETTTTAGLGTTTSSVSIHLYALEHRYYGVSYPLFDAGDPYASAVTNANLSYLSSRQAVADMAHFIERVVVQKGQPKTTVILFGGSYPGMLAAWTRLGYPHLVQGAVSNSAPVQAVLDFAAYQQHVANDLADPALGGSAQCHHIVQTGHEELRRIMMVPELSSVDQLQRLAQQFRLCDVRQLLQDPRNVQLWIGDGVIPLDAQGNDPACTSSPYCNLAKKCAALIDRYQKELDDEISPKNETLAAVNTLAWMVNETMDSTNENDDDDSDNSNNACIDLDWEATVAYIADPHRAWEGGLRSWLWQTCTEFGFYQTCETTNGKCPFARGGHPLSQDLELCQQAFGVAPTLVAEAVQATNEWSGGWQSGATNVLSVTGTADPWSELAVQRRTNAPTDGLVHQVTDASHHFWTHPVQATDDSAVQEAREVIFQTVRGWVLGRDLQITTS